MLSAGSPDVTESEIFSLEANAEGPDPGGRHGHHSVAPGRDSPLGGLPTPLQDHDHLERQRHWSIGAHEAPPHGTAAIALAAAIAHRVRRS